MADNCENCWYYIFDDDTGDGFCDLKLDEDEYARLMEYSNNKTCRYFRADTGEYGIVRKQN